MRHFKPNKQASRIARIHLLIKQLPDLNADPLKIHAIYKRLDSALQFLSWRHNARANAQLTIALALLRNIP